MGNSFVTADLNNDFAVNMQQEFGVFQQWLDHTDTSRLYKNLFLQACSWFSFPLKEGHEALESLKKLNKPAYEYHRVEAQRLLDKYEEAVSGTDREHEFREATRIIPMVLTRLLQFYAYDPLTAQQRGLKTQDISDEECFTELSNLCTKYLNFSIERSDITVRMYTAARRGNSDIITSLGKVTANPAAMMHGYMNALMLKGAVNNLLDPEPPSQDVIDTVCRMVNCFRKLIFLSNFCVTWKKKGKHTLDNRMNRYRDGDYFAAPSDLPELFDLYRDIKRNTNWTLTEPSSGLMMLGNAYRDDGLIGLVNILRRYPSERLCVITRDSGTLAGLCQQTLVTKQCKWMSPNRVLYTSDTCQLFTMVINDYMNAHEHGKQSLVEDIVDWKLTKSKQPARSLGVQSALLHLGWID